MTLKILCLLSLLIFLTHAEVLPLFDPRIVNGEDVKVGEIPYQVSFQYKNASLHYCSGAILSVNYVITAAHCVYGIHISFIKIVAATVNLNEPKSTHNLAELIVHLGYNPNFLWAKDIALVRVKTPFFVSETIGYIPLPPRGHVVKPNDVAVVSGWGRLWEEGPISTKLQRVNVLIANHTYCEYIYNKTGTVVRPTQICAYDPSHKKGPCHGDSGGPLVVDGKLVGLVSWGSGCASTSHPAVYTRVASFLDWIKDNL